jgi:hypothetical protein
MSPERGPIPPRPRHGWFLVSLEVHALPEGVELEVAETSDYIR